MKARPILFSKPMVLALLAGTKTQTRRVLRDGDWLDPKEGVMRMASVGAAITGFQYVACPYGAIGDQLWVREAYRLVVGYDLMKPSEVSEGVPVRYEADGLGAEQTDGWRWGKLRPSMFMPRHVSRITLEVTGVRAERLQDISDADAAAEGCPCYVCGAILDGHSEADCHCFHRTATPGDYSTLWDGINGIGSWNANPFVWVVSFKVLL